MSRPAPISIALPVYNGANYLPEALASIQAQTFADFEVVISDNASTDETPEICREYAQRDPRIKVERIQQFLLQAENVNRAVERASGKWVKLFCHDDLMVSDCMARIWDVAAGCSPGLGLIGNGEQWLFANGFCHRLNPANKGLVERNGRELLRGQLMWSRDKPLDPPWPSLTTATVRKAAWLAAGRFSPQFSHFDVFLWAKLLMDWDYIFIPEILTTNRIHGTQVAVSARRSLRSVSDNRLFWSDFVRVHGKRLDLTLWSRWLVRNRWLGAAGSIVAVQLLRRDYRGATETLFALPVVFWPLLPAFIARSYRYESQKIRSIVPNVPMNVLYPS